VRLPRAGAAALAQALVALVVAIRYGNDGVLAIAAALVLGPLAVLATARLAKRIAGRTFAARAAWTLVLLPLAATVFFTTGYRHTWLHVVLPQLVGVRAVGWYAVGVLIAIVAAVVPARAAALGAALAAVAGLVAYDAGALGDVRSNIHETGWSVALAEWLPVAGAIGTARRAPLFAVALAGWLVFFALRGAAHGYDGGVFWASLAPAMPAAALLVSSLALLVPRLRPASPARQVPTAR
jgi:hypothetical protein